MISEAYPPDTWTHVYTDRSTTDAIQDGEAGIFISYTNGQTGTASIATGVYCTNYKAEVEAISQAVRPKNNVIM